VPVVTFACMLAGNLAEFDVDAFKAKLAALMRVLVSDLLVRVSAGSVMVETTVMTYTAQKTASTVDAITELTPAALGTQLGLDVEYIGAPTEGTALASPSPPPSSGSAASSSAWLSPSDTMWIAVGLVFLGLAQMIAACIFVSGVCFPKRQLIGVQGALPPPPPARPPPPPPRGTTTREEEVPKMDRDSMVELAMESVHNGRPRPPSLRRPSLASQEHVGATT